MYICIYVYAYKAGWVLPQLLAAIEHAWQGPPLTGPGCPFISLGKLVTKPFSPCVFSPGRFHILLASGKQALGLCQV